MSRANYQSRKSFTPENLQSKPPAVDFHDDLASSWSLKYEISSGFKSRFKCISVMLDRVGDIGSELWIDGGCGAGNLAFELSRRGAHVVGFDASCAMIQAAKCEAEKMGLSENCRFDVIPDICDLRDTESRSVDGVVCSSVIEYLDRPDDALREFSRVLKIQGVLLVSVPNKESLVRMILRIIFKFTKKPSYLKFVLNHYSKRSFLEQMSSIGFESISVSYGGLGRGPDGSRFWGSLIFFLFKNTSIP